MKSIFIPILLLLLMTGCWNKTELNEWGFVRAVAIDMDPKGNFTLTSQLYKPAGESPEKNKDGGYFTVTSSAKSLNEAAQDIMIHIGRKTQWSHMNIVLISNLNVNKKTIQEIVDYFLRDPESRETTLVALTEGKAQDYLTNDKPIMNNTIVQQFRKMALLTQYSTGKTQAVTMLQYAIQLKSESGISIMPVLHKQENEPKQTSVSGMAIFKNGELLSEDFKSNDVQNILILRNQFQSGLKKASCETTSAYESIQIDKANTAIAVIPSDPTIKIRIRVHIEGMLANFTCIHIDTTEKEEQAKEWVRSTIEKNLMVTIKDMQRKHIDILGIGDLIYRKQPAKWVKWKNDWDRKFQEAEVDLSVDFKFRGSLGQNLNSKMIESRQTDG